MAETIKTTIEDSYPLSPMQQAMLVASQISPGSGIYIEQMVCTFREDLDIDAFRRAWQQVLERHDVLRTTFDWESSDEPRQQIVSGLVIPFEILDWQGIPASSREQRYEEFVREDQARGFELSQAPLMRLMLIRFGPAFYRFIWTSHHVILDGISRRTIIEEIFARYDAIRKGEDLDLDATGPYRDYIDWYRQQNFTAAEAFWKEYLQGFNPESVRLTANHTQYGSDNNAEDVLMDLSEDVTASLEQLAKNNGVTLSTVVHGAWLLLLSRYTGQDDVVTGTVRAGRHWTDRPEQYPAGLFLNTPPLRARISSDKPLTDWLQEIRQSQVSMRHFEHASIIDIIRWVSTTRGRSLFDSIVVFNNDFLNTYLQSKGGTWQNREFFVRENNGHPLTLFGYAETRLKLRLGHITRLFTEIQARHILDYLATLLEKMAKEPHLTLGEFPEPVEQLDREPGTTHGVADTDAGSRDKGKLVISASFTAEPLRESLGFWQHTLDLPLDFVFAPFNQVYQQLLNPSSELMENRHGANVVLVRFEDWLSARSNGRVRESLQENAKNLVLAMSSAAERSRVPFIFCVCPPSSAVTADTERYRLLKEIEDHVYDELKNTAIIYVMNSREIEEFYPVSSYYDAEADEIGSVPYTPAYYAALGTMIVRKLVAIQSKPYKVVVADCDNTLWSGVCGEDGPLEVEVDGPRRRLQEFLIRQHDAGMLICLCSKNNEADVSEVFNRNPGMVLTRDHIVTWKINWDRKSTNIRSLAQELNLGMDSFIFIDDNPTECAEVRASCPEVLTLCLPADADVIPSFLEHVWAFDYVKRTEEDRSRTELYKRNARREEFRKQAQTLGQFLAELDLEVRITPVRPDQIARAAQLTQRTNQFNSTTIRRSEHEFEQLVQSGQLECLVVDVTDRFGDYGIVGVIMFETGSGTLFVDSLLLSCRVLGRGVEYQLLNRLGEIAVERGLANIEIRYIASAKNQPVSLFLEKTGTVSRRPAENETIFGFQADAAKVLAYNPDDEIAPEPAGTGIEPAVGEVREPAPVRLPAMFDNYTHISENLKSIPKILEEIDEKNQRSREYIAGEYSSPETDIMRQLAEIWQSVLHVDRVGITDNFFELGGDSLLALRIFARVREISQRELKLTDMFRLPTISTLSAYITGDGEDKEVSSRQASINRAQSRRAALQRRRQSRHGTT